MLLANRDQAGRELAAEVARQVPVSAAPRPLVLALPRGGVPVAVPVAVRLGADLDVLLVRKISAPGRPEFGVGAIAEDGPPVFDARALGAFGLTPEDLGATVAAERAELDRQRARYRGGRPAAPVAGRVVVLVDDGLATGVTARAALRRLALQRPARLVLAVPVGARGSCDRLRDEADTVVCLHTPEPFSAVGRWYADFAQVSDAEVEAA